MEFFKTLIATCSRIILHIFLLFPIDSQKILFYPANGHYYCNLKYIDQEIEREKLPVTKIWITKTKTDSSYPHKVVQCNIHSLAFLYHFFTSSIILFNNGIPSWLFKRNNQTFINTWHGGGAYKKVDAVAKNLSSYWKKKRMYRIVDVIDYTVSSCKKFTEAMREDMALKCDFLDIGMPRNDIFFDVNKMSFAEKKVKRFYHLNLTTAIVIYAPTFRDNGITLDLNVEELLKSLNQRFNKNFVLFVRSHPHVAKDIFAQVEKPENVVDVSAYPDMQELLAASDVLITDYSSSMWDFSFTYRPCFIYANDLSHYRHERNFHTPIEEWPFPLAENNRELQQNIINFVSPTVYKNNVLKHQQNLGSYERGIASQEMCKLIDRILF